MKPILFLVFFCCCSVSFAQDGFAIIRKAEKKIESGKLVKASRLLDEADDANYGFCGNAWAEARDAIALNRAKIFALKGQKKEAALAVWNVGGPLSRYHDSLKMTYLIEAFGKEQIKTELDAVLDSAKLSSSGVSHVVDVQFSFAEMPYPLYFYDAAQKYSQRLLEQDSQTTPNKELFLELFREEPFYKLLENDE